MRAVHGSTVLYPCDANQTAKLVAEMADRDGIVYLRTTRAATRRSSTAPDEEFPIGGSRVLRDGRRPSTIVARRDHAARGAEGGRAARAARGSTARVIDLYSVKPVDAETLRAAAEATGGRILTVEDHWPEGGLGDAVLEALADGETPARVVRLAVREMPGSGKPAELLAAAGIDAEHIAEAARSLVGAAVGRARRAAGRARAAARGRRVDLGRARVGLVRRAERCRLRLDAEPFEHVDGGAPRRALRRRRTPSPAARARRRRPASTSRSRAARGPSRPPRAPRAAARRSPRFGRRRLRARPAAGRRLGVEGEPGDRAGRPRVPARTALAAEQRQEGQTVGVGLARLEPLELQRSLEPGVEVAAVGDGAALDHAPLVEQVAEQPVARLRLAARARRGRRPRCRSSARRDRASTQPAPRFEQAPSPSGG